MTEQDARKHALALALQSVPETYAQRNMKPEIQFIQLRSEATPYSDATPEIDATSNPVWYVSLTGIWYTDMPAAGAQPTTPTYAHDTLTIIFDARTGKELSREYTSTHH